MDENKKAGKINDREVKTMCNGCAWASPETCRACKCRDKQSDGGEIPPVMRPGRRSQAPTAQTQQTKFI